MHNTCWTDRFWRSWSFTDQIKVPVKWYQNGGERRSISEVYPLACTKAEKEKLHGNNKTLCRENWRELQWKRTRLRIVNGVRSWINWSNSPVNRIVISYKNNLFLGKRVELLLTFWTFFTPAINLRKSVLPMAISSPAQFSLKTLITDIVRFAHLISIWHRASDGHSASIDTDVS